MNMNVGTNFVELSQPALINKGLKLLNLDHSKSVKTPLTPAVQLHSASDADHQAFLKLNINYRTYTGMLNYLACRTRPDLASAVSILSRFNQKPGLSHWKEVVHCWKYLLGTQDLGLRLEPEDDSIEERIHFYTDATWAEDQQTRISQKTSRQVSLCNFVIKHGRLTNNSGHEPFFTINSRNRPTSNPNQTLEMDAINSTILKTTIEAIPILTEENFSTWRTRITALFKLGGVKDAMINGEPVLEDDDNTILCAIILAKLSSTTHSNVVNSNNEDNAQDLWKAITKRFVSSEPSNRARVYNMFANISFDASNIEKFITEVRSALVKMEDVGIKLDEDILTYDLLRRLPASLDNIKQSITHSKNGEEITPDSLLNHLEIHINELKVSSSGSKQEATTMYTKEDRRCTPGKHNPLAAHPKERCWYDANKSQAPWAKKQQEVNVSCFSTFSLNHPSAFILDSGCTSHMVSDRKLFINLDETEGGLINTSSKSNALAIAGRGSIIFSYNGYPLIIHDVLLVPAITANLLSVRQLLLKQCQVDFQLNHFRVTKDDETLFEGSYCNDLPVIPFKTSCHQSHLSIAEKLHKSLGHVSYSRIRNKLGIPIKPDGICTACAVSKSTKASYKHRTSRASKPFEELHLDLIGPITPMSHLKHKYILTIVDSNTRLKYALEVEAKRIGYYPLIIHSDRGTEFVNEAMDLFCRTNAIKQTFSDAYTPQQNGLAERFNRTILESLRTILHDSGIRKNLWNEILSASTLTLNQIPAHKSKKSPYELFKGVSISLDFFRPIGNTVAVYSHQAKNKLEPRGELGKLIGFNPELKSYRILLKDNQIINSKNVEFLDFEGSSGLGDYHDELLVEDKIEKRILHPPVLQGSHSNIEVKQEDEDEDFVPQINDTDDFETADESLENDDNTANKTSEILTFHRRSNIIQKSNHQFELRSMDQGY
ncbi:hypothetical protein VP01_3031g1 [Puccinia sorghi]|uniref:Integrase catalytic domain-containing protein n=1 Tax=Puccinia sorghi TaxID=27349 RepID=A0A0L6V014_9BASI|nr:hypothetical protein VP01_3031g1 [Puccinia sorghi]